MRPVNNVLTADHNNKAVESSLSTFNSFVVDFCSLLVNLLIKIV